MPMEIREFTAADIPDALALCRQVNWNHLAADWQRCLDLNPRGCIGGFIDGRLRGTCTIGRFGSLGWVGTFLVDEALRGQGYGKQVFAAMLDRAESQGLEWLGLDSSDAGRPIYLKCGFVTADGNELWSGPNAGDSTGGTEPLGESHWPDVLALDSKKTGVDRAAQLRHFAAEVGATGRVLAAGGRITGYGLSRPGHLAGAIGPVVAASAAAALALTQDLAADRRRLDGERGIALAVLDKDDLKSELASRGFAMRRRMIRMFRPGQRFNALNGEGVFVSSGLGMG